MMPPLDPERSHHMRTRRAPLSLIAFLLIGLTPTAYAATGTVTVTTFTLQAASGGFDSGIDVAPGDRVCILATGSWKVSDGSAPVGPMGSARSFLREATGDGQFVNGNRGALIARIGSLGDR